jgi:hypothetical protein
MELLVAQHEENSAFVYLPNEFLSKRIFHDQVRGM